MNKLEDNGSSYKQIIKATSIIGGTQIVNIIIAVLRTKIIAVSLGVSGVGIWGIFTVTIGLISSISCLGLNFSAVRTITESISSNDEKKICRTVVAVRRWIRFTGILSAVFTIIFAQKLSDWAFGNLLYSWAFYLLSIALFAQTINSGQLAILQGFREIKKLAKVNIAGSVIGLIVSLPLYWLFRNNGIVPGIIISTIVATLASYSHSKKISAKFIPIKMKESFIDGFSMVRLGFVMMITAFASNGVMYIIRMAISDAGGVEQVGLYTAAWTIINGYIGMVFSAMATDYFPRLTSVNKESQLINKTVSEQSEMALLILGPLLLILIPLLPTLITILYSSKFLDMLGMMRWSLIAILIKAVNWAMGFVILAKGESKIYFFTELLSDIILLTTSLILYKWYNLNGLGVAFLLFNILQFWVLFFALRIRYDFSFRRQVFRHFFFQISLVLVASYASFILGIIQTIIISFVCLTISLIYVITEIKKITNLPIFKAIQSVIKN